MKFSDYQMQAMSYAKDPTFSRPCTDTPWLGIIEEVGELLGQIKRVRRDDGDFLTVERREKILAEAGDLLWYMTALGVQHHIPFFPEDEHLEERGCDEGGDPFRAAFRLSQTTATWLSFAESQVVPWVNPNTLVQELPEPLSFYNRHMMVNYANQVLDIMIQIVTWADSSLLDVAERNLLKLAGRKERGTLYGDGSSR